MPGELRDTVPVPRRVLDDLMPELGDTALRVILAVTRQTLGWRAEGGGRKAREWITHSWLKRMTGRSGSAVSDAVESLAQQGLIVVTDAKGREVRTKEARRAHRGRLYYAVAEVGHEARPSRVPWDRAESGVGKAETMKERVIKQGSKEIPARRTVPAGAGSWSKVGGSRDR